MAVVALVYFTLNFTQAAFFRRYGFMAAILVGVGFYVVWHAVLLLDTGLKLLAALVTLA